MVSRRRLFSWSLAGDSFRLTSSSPASVCWAFYIDIVVDGQAHSWAFFVDIVVDVQAHSWTSCIDIVVDGQPPCWALIFVDVVVDGQPPCRTYV